MEKIGFVKKLSMVMQATSDDESPVPGYLYPEICNVSLESIGVCESLLDFLVDRLQKPTAHVKVKVLKLMTYVVKNGNPDFAQGLRKKSHGIRDACSFSGPPDPLHGNVPYLLVRKVAQELCEQLFDIKELESSLPVTHMVHTTGIGSSTNSGKYEGFGNAPHLKESLADSFLTGLERWAEQASITPAEHRAAEMRGLERVKGEYSTAGQFSVLESHHDIGAELLDNTESVRLRQHIPGRAGGGWDDIADNTAPTEHVTVSTQECVELSRIETLTLDDYKKESDLVNQFVDDRTKMLTRSQLNNIVNNCQSLNCEKIAEILCGMITDRQSPSICMVMDIKKCLQCLEGLLHNDLVTCDFMSSACQGCLAAVSEDTGNVLDDAYKPAKDKATKLIKITEKLCEFKSSPQPLMDFRTDPIKDVT